MKRQRVAQEKAQVLVPVQIPAPDLNENAAFFITRWLNMLAEGKWTGKLPSTRELSHRLPCKFPSNATQDKMSKREQRDEVKRRRWISGLLTVRGRAGAGRTTLVQSVLKRLKWTIICPDLADKASIQSAFQEAELGHHNGSRAVLLLDAWEDCAWKSVLAKYVTRHLAVLYRTQPAQCIPIIMVCNMEYDTTSLELRKHGQSIDLKPLTTKDIVKALERCQRAAQKRAREEGASYHAPSDFLFAECAKHAGGSLNTAISLVKTLSLRFLSYPELQAMDWDSLRGDYNAQTSKTSASIYDFVMLVFGQYDVEEGAACHERVDRVLDFVEATLQHAKNAPLLQDPRRGVKDGLRLVTRIRELHATHAASKEVTFLLMHGFRSIFKRNDWLHVKHPKKRGDVASASMRERLRYDIQMEAANI